MRERQKSRAFPGRSQHPHPSATPRLLLIPAAAATLLMCAGTGCRTTSHPATDTTQPAGDSRGIIPAQVQPPETLTLAQARELARNHHPGLAAMRHRLTAATATEQAAGLLPNPELELGVAEYNRNDAGMDSAELEASLTQRFEPGGKRRLRKQLATAQRHHLKLDYDLALLETEAEASRRFIALLATRRRHALATEAVTLAEKGAMAADERVRSGKASPLEAAKAHTQLQLARLAADEAARQQARSVQRLTAMWGGGTLHDANPVDDHALARIPEQLPDPAATTSTAAPSPRLQSLEQAIAISTLELHTQRAARIPDIEAAFGVQAFREDDSDALTLSASLPLPLFDRNSANIAAAKAGVAAAVSDHEAGRLALETQHADLSSELQAAHQRAIAFRDSFIPAMQQAFDAAHEGYRQGKLDYLDLLDAQRSLVEANEQLTDALAHYHICAVNLNELTGNQPEHQ